MTPSPLPDYERVALRLAKGRYAHPREWVDPLDALKQARFNARHWPDGRPAPLVNTYADAYRQLRNRIPRAAHRLRMIDLLVLDAIHHRPLRRPC